MTQPRDEGPLARWSRRKQQSVLESEQEDLELQLHTQEDSAAELERLNPEANGEPEVPVLTDADMPAIDTLTEDSDFSGFMSSGVSDKLRNLALRKLFGAPSFNIRDGLDEYDEDYTYFEKLGDIVTADMKHQIELAEAEKAEHQSAGESPEESDSIADSAEDESFEQVAAESEEMTSEHESIDSDTPNAKSDGGEPESPDHDRSGSIRGPS